MKCEYCKTEGQEGLYCDKCGAKLPDKKKATDIIKCEPFFYNGYIVYLLRDYMMERMECQFWLGRELIERIVVDRYVLEEIVPQGCEYMPFFWDLFLLAHGEKEVIEWQEKNNKYPAMFEIRRIENKEKEYMLSLSMRELATVSKK